MDGTCNPVPAKRSFRRTRIFNQIAPYCLICPHRDTSIKWGQGVNIGMFSRLACINEISLGNTVLTGPNVFISDHNHAYEDVEKPISAQGNIGNNNKVIIDDDCWIGTNVVICGNVHIRKHIVIGAGTFVNLGTFQISDLFYNTLGGAVGGVIYYLGYC